jgi:carbamoyl-phosphate synthase small subunit
MPQEAANNRPAYLLLEDGTLFKGKSFGKTGTSGGEICFNTGMTGYQEVFTDPSYTGQMLVMNTCYVGNYGVNESDVESVGVKINGLICKNIANRFSRMTANGSLEDYLIHNNIVAIQDIDTRALVQHIRTKGSMNCVISSETGDPAELRKSLDKVPKMEGLDLASGISTKGVYHHGNETAALRISVLDFGIKKSMLNCLAEKDVYLKVFPSTATFEELKSFQPDGIFVSNGPGDPAAMAYAVKTIKDIIASGIPMFGICLGHQLLAIANGIPTFKMHHGHRGLNHPVKNVITGKSEITTQNHGFGIDAEATKNNDNVEITHINLNDGSVEGIRLKEKPVFSVQYHPESTPGSHDSRYLFDQFIDLIQQSKNK